jgi:hypothetical protein
MLINLSQQQLPLQHHAMAAYCQALLAVSDWIDRSGLEDVILIALFAITLATSATLLLTLRDSRGRFSMRRLLLLTAYVAVIVSAATLFMRVVHRP